MYIKFKNNCLCFIVDINDLFICIKCYLTIFIIIILFIVQCWTQASKPEPLKQDTQKEKENKLILNTLR